MNNATQKTEKEIGDFKTLLQTSRTWKNFTKLHKNSRSSRDFVRLYDFITFQETSRSHEHSRNLKESHEIMKLTFMKSWMKTVKVF
jgi:hypothetical protein